VWVRGWVLGVRCQGSGLGARGLGGSGARGARPSSPLQPPPPLQPARAPASRGLRPHSERRSTPSTAGAGQPLGRWGRALGRRPHAAGRRPRAGGRSPPVLSPHAIASACSDGTGAASSMAATLLPEPRYILSPPPIALCLQDVLVPGRRRPGRAIRRPSGRQLRSLPATARVRPIAQPSPFRERLIDSVIYRHRIARSSRAGGFRCAVGWPIGCPIEQETCVHRRLCTWVQHQPPPDHPDQPLRRRRTPAAQHPTRCAAPPPAPQGSPAAEGLHSPAEGVCAGGPMRRTSAGSSATT